jgi:hypothetical protein
MRLLLVLIFSLLVPHLARTDELERGGLQLARDLEARVGDVLDRSVERAAERATAALEAREAERLDRVARAAAWRVERQLARSRERGEWRDRIEAELAALAGGSGIRGPAPRARSALRRD